MDPVHERGSMDQESMFCTFPESKNHQSGLRDSEDESDAKIFSVSESETGQQSAPHIQLELLPRQPQQVIEFLLKIILTVNTSVS